MRKDEYMTVEDAIFCTEYIIRRELTEEELKKLYKLTYNETEDYMVASLDIMEDIIGRKFNNNDMKNLEKYLRS